MDDKSFIQEVMMRFRSHLKEISSAHRETILESGRMFVSDSRLDLERWTGLLASGVLTKNELEWLVRAKVDLAEMEVLKQEGLTLARIDELRAALAGAVTGAVMHVIGM